MTVAHSRAKKAPLSYDQAADIFKRVSIGCHNARANDLMNLPHLLAECKNTYADDLVDLSRYIEHQTSDGLEDVRGPPIHVACLLDHHQLMTACLRDPTTASVRFGGDYPLHTLLELKGREPSEHSIDLLLQAGANINGQNRFKETPLIIAFQKGKFKTAQLLLKRGANVNIADQYGRTPLIIAADNHSKQLVNSALAAGASVDACTNLGVTALHYADSVPIIKTLIGHGAPVNVFNSKGDTPLCNVLNIPNHAAARCASHLLQAGSTIANVDWSSAYVREIFIEAWADAAPHLAINYRTHCLVTLLTEQPEMSVWAANQLAGMTDNQSNGA